MFLWDLGAVLFIGCNNEKAAEAKTDTTTATAAAETKMAPAEFADLKYKDVGKNAMDALSKGDVDAWLSNYADNAVYIWNNGDSLAGKAAIGSYWKKRRTEVIDSLTYSNAIFLPIKVNQPQSVEQSGVWLLGWYQVKAKYKTGKSMSQWIHMDMHFDANDKIDRAIQYIDMSLVKAAATK